MTFMYQYETKNNKLPDRGPLPKATNTTYTSISKSHKYQIDVHYQKPVDLALIIFWNTSGDVLISYMQKCGYCHSEPRLLLYCRCSNKKYRNYYKCSNPEPVMQQKK